MYVKLKHPENLLAWSNEIFIAFEAKNGLINIYNGIKHPSL